MKKIILLTAIAVVLFISGCNHKPKGCFIAAGIEYYTELNANALDNFINDWYSVQKGYIKDIPLDKRVTNEDQRCHDLYVAFSDQSVLPVIKAKTSTFALHNITVHDYGVTYSYIHTSIQELGVGFSIHFGNGLFDEYVKTNDLVADDGKVYTYDEDNDCNYWVIDIGYGYLTITTYNGLGLDMKNLDTVYEYFEYDTIDIVEYESQTK